MLSLLSIKWAEGAICLPKPKSSKFHLGIWNKSFAVFWPSTYRKLSNEELMLLNCSVGEDSWESLGLQGDPTSPSLGWTPRTVHWKDWCWSWNSNTLATWYKEQTHWKRPWCWERLRAGGEGDCSTPGFPVYHQLPELTQIHLHWISDTIQPSHPLLSPSPLQSFPASGLVLHICWPKYLSFSFSFNINPSNEYSGLISFRIHSFDLFAVQGTLKSLLQHHSSKASILWGSAFFIVQLSNPYMTTGKTIALTRRTFVSKVMSLLFNMLSRLVIVFLPRSKCLLISWKD